MGGLQFLAALLHDRSFTVRLHRKVMTLLYDLVINDENII